MPRQRQTAAGYPALARPPVAGQTYGNGADQQQLDQAMPTPNVQSAPPAPATAPVLQQAEPAPGAYDHQAALATAQQLAGETGVLQRESTRPNEPITAGLSRGPGPGPEALGLTQGTPTGDMLRRLSAELGDPFFADLAARARA